MKSLFVVLLVLLLALLVMPVTAQDDETPPFVTVTSVAVEEPETDVPVVVVDQPADSDLSSEFAQVLRDTLMAVIGQMGYIFIIVMGIFALMLVVVGLPVFYWMYHSTPSPFKPMVKEGMLGAMTKLQSEVDKATAAAKENEVDWDDDGWLWLQKMMKTNRAKLETFFAEESGAPPVITG